MTIINLQFILTFPIDLLFPNECNPSWPHFAGNLFHGSFQEDKFLERVEIVHPNRKMIAAAPNIWWQRNWSHCFDSRIYCWEAWDSSELYSVRCKLKFLSIRVVRSGRVFLHGLDQACMIKRLLKVQIMLQNIDRFRFDVCRQCMVNAPSQMQMGVHRYKTTTTRRLVKGGKAGSLFFSNSCLLVSLDWPWCESYFFRRNGWYTYCNPLPFDKVPPLLFKSPWRIQKITRGEKVTKWRHSTEACLLQYGTVD